MNSNQEDKFPWKELLFTQDGITLNAKYWDKDFTLKYESKHGTLKYGLHFPYANSFRYTESIILERCKEAAPWFLQAEKYISENQDVLNNVFESLKEDVPQSKDSKDKKKSALDSCDNRIFEWAHANVERDIEQIIRNYLKVKCLEAGLSLYH